MGMYTELFVNISLKKEIPQHIIDIITFMCGDHSLPNGECSMKGHPLENEPLFKTDKWHWMLNSSSYYTQGASVNKFYKDEINGEYHLTVLSSFKNYCQEIDLFFKWILPYIDLDDGHYITFIGYHRYEERDKPTLIYIDNETGLLV